MADRRSTSRVRARTRRLVALSAGVVAAVVAGILLLGPGDEEQHPSPPAGDGTALPANYPFGPDSVWRQDISGAPVAENSREQVAYLTRQVQARRNGVAAFNVNQFTAAFYTVSAEQPRVDVAFDDCRGLGHTPGGLLGRGGQFSQVPIPENATPAIGSDGQLTVYSPATDQLWEFWKAARTAGGGWQACWGGRIDDVSTSAGFFRGMYGASASGLAISGGMVWVDDARAGRIDHALSLQLTEAAHWKQVSWPAQRSDGADRSPDAVAEGTRFRLSPDVDVDSLGLTPLGTAVARAAQEYGFIVTDRAGNVAVTAESGQEVDGQDDPWPRLLGGADSWTVLAGFPWKDLQALPRDYGEPARSTTAPSSPAQESSATGSPAD